MNIKVTNQQLESLVFGIPSEGYDKIIFEQNNKEISISLRVSGESNKYFEEDIKSLVDVEISDYDKTTYITLWVQLSTYKKLLMEELDLFTLLESSHAFSKNGPFAYDEEIKFEKEG